MIAVPVGADGRRRRADVLALASFTVAATLAGIVIGLVLWSLGTLAGALRARELALLVAAVLATGYGISEILSLGWPLPQRHWQVPQRWGTLGRSLYAAAFGAILGAGLLTFIPYAGYYVLLLLAASVADWRWSVLLLTLFAWARVVPIVVLSERLVVVKPAERFRLALGLSEQVVAVSARLARPRGALLIAVAVASVRVLLG